MTADLKEVSSEVSRDLAPEWLELSSRVRRLAIELQANSPGESALASNALRLCDHVERLHSDVEQLLANINEEPATIAVQPPLETAPVTPANAIDHANIQIQKEMHQKSDLQHIIKALFMWKDDPVERVHGKADPNRPSAQ